MGVHEFPRGEPRHPDGSGEPPHNDGMEERLRQLEIDLAVMKSNYAKSEDVIKAKHEMVFWIVGTAVITQLVPALPGFLRAVGWLQ